MVWKPATYKTVYVLTKGTNLTIVATSATQQFDVTATGDYTIHTLVYDPATLDLTKIVLGTTTGGDVDKLLVQGGGVICAALDLNGAKFNVKDCQTATCDATAGTLKATTTTGGFVPCIKKGGTTIIEATQNAAPKVPAGYSVAYVLTNGNGLVISQLGKTPSFTIADTGKFTIHTLVFDTATLKTSIVKFGTTTGFDVNKILIQGGGTVCGALDVAGAMFKVKYCDTTVTCTNTKEVKSVAITNCDDLGYVCLNIPQTNAANYGIVVDGKAFTGQTQLCDLNPTKKGLAIGLKKGTYSILITNKTTGCVDTVLAKIECKKLTIDTIPLVMTVKDSTKGCVKLEAGFANGGAVSYSLCNGDKTGSSVYGSYSVDANGCLKYTAKDKDGKDVEKICVTACNAAGVCDTTIFVITIKKGTTPPVTCNNGVFKDEVVNIAVNCGDKAAYCFKLPLDSLVNYTLTTNNKPYTNGFKGCMFDTTFAYNYFTLPGQGSTPPYKLNSWIVNGKTFTATLKNIPALVDSMNVWVSAGPKI